MRQRQNIDRIARRDCLRYLSTAMLGGFVGSGINCAISQSAFAQTSRKENLAVLYPEIGEPFRAVFAKILEGIDDKLQTRTYKLAVPSDTDLSAMVADLRRSDLKVVIALGRAGMRLASALERGVDVVAGGIISPTENEARDASILCLAPDPSLLLQRLKTLLPTAKRVNVAYSARHSAWLMRFAQDAAKQTGLDLRAQEVSDLRGALRYYQDFFAQATSQDALWLLQDPLAVDDSSVLPLVLQECWNKNLPLFSSNVAHVRRGALFSLYPDNLELGRSLGRSALARLNSNAPLARGAVPLRDVQAALNTRTASHLGLDVTPQFQSGFQLLLPER
ncbi:ABC transporter substrate binding protein [Undibacterium flavidum]|uniref:ABC transport system substrate-binding protein n=1 Tax=Undibacterium flavidum TaxID=2762297 RepID=A0ABR6YG34_9BURK|nr:ABC transporter substrate binding protein [Undibacterium flavidum]MBC3875434.1 hypothetical protein [Undibacterium flavidum]